MLLINIIFNQRCLSKFVRQPTSELLLLALTVQAETLTGRGVGVHMAIPSLCW